MEDTFDTMQLDTPEDALTILERLNGGDDHSEEVPDSDNEVEDEGDEEDGADDSNSREDDGGDAEDEDDSEMFHDRSRHGVEQQQQQQQQQQQHPEPDTGTYIPIIIRGI
jgi:hypothetical protein